MKEILELMQANGLNKIELIHLVDMAPIMGESDEDVMVVNTIEQDKQGTLLCYDNRDEDEQDKYQPIWNVAKLPKQVQDELLYSLKYTLQQKSSSVIGRKVWVVSIVEYKANENYLNSYTELYADEQQAKARVNEYSTKAIEAAPEHDGLDDGGELVGEQGYVTYFKNGDIAKVKYMEKEVKTEEIRVNGFDLMVLNREFAELLKAHKDDTEVHGKSRGDFKHLMACVNNDEGLVSYHASICNAWDELCNRHDGLRESGLSWFAGAEWTAYPNNDWDVYVGAGDELD